MVVPDLGRLVGKPVVVEARGMAGKPGVVVGKVLRFWRKLLDQRQLFGWLDVCSVPMVGNHFRQRYNLLQLLLLEERKKSLIIY